MAHCFSICSSTRLFREKLEDYIDRIPRAELMVLARDMNVHVGEMCDGFEGIHGKSFWKKECGR